MASEQVDACKLSQEVTSITFVNTVHDTYLLREKGESLNSPACQVEATVLRNALTHQ